jgi:hypothetical protein
MKEDNVDQQIRKKLQERTIQPSASAWERLSSQLDDAEQKKKRHWFLYVGYAASIALMVSLFFFLTQSDENTSDIPENVIVQEEVKTPQLDTTKEFTTLPVEDNAIVQNENQEVRSNPSVSNNTFERGKKEVKRKERIVKKNQTQPFKSSDVATAVAKQEPKKAPQIDVQQKIKELTQNQESTVVNANIPKEKGLAPIKKEAMNSRISVDSDALLMSVTSTRDELRAYYKKYKIDRAEVLATIEKELKKSSIKVDPNSILAEVERDVSEESFQNNFYQFIKKRVSSVATAIANRNN